MTAAALACGSCGTELPPNSKFCNECGAAVANATTSAEYKQVTVVFADVVTMLCGIAWRVHEHVAGERFEELRELCTAAGDKASLAIATAGLVIDHAFQGRIREASQLASEAMALIESIGDPTLMVGLSLAAIYAKMLSGEVCDVLRWSQRVIDLADGDPSKGNFIFGSPLALAFATRAFARYCLGRPGWGDDLRHGLAMARSADPASYATVVGYVYNAAIPAGVLSPEDRAVREIEGCRTGCRTIR